MREKANHSGFKQIAYVVRDLDEACRQFSRIYGIGPFLAYDVMTLGDHVYRGKPASPIRLRAAFGQSEDLNVELIQLFSEAPSAFHDMFPSGETGLHHMAMFCDDYAGMKAQLAAQGFEVASEFARLGGQKVCFVDMRKSLGHMLELYEAGADLVKFYARVRQMSDDWDGKEAMISWPPKR
jgi:hypothetical protein